MQVRPASIDGVTPEEIIEGVVTADGNYEIVIPEEIPLEVESETESIISQILGSVSLLSSSEMEQGTGFIIRVYSETAGGWVYSYAENNDSTIIANVNPYTDRMIRIFYATANNSFLDKILEDVNPYNQSIDSIFLTGTFERGYPINVPLKETVNTAMLVMNKILFHVYGMNSIQDALQGNWEIDQGLDAMLNDPRFRELSSFLQYEFENIFNEPSGIVEGYAIHLGANSIIKVEIWTIHDDNISIPVMYFYNKTYTMTRLGLGHFYCETDSIGEIDHYSYRNVAFEFYDETICQLAVTWL